ncbi:MAG: hypothetical protein ABR518_00280, partial [Actinomycetota bacterium]
SMATKDRAAALELPPGPERSIGWLMAGRDGRLLIVAIAAFIGAPAWGLWAVALTGGAGVALRTLAVRRVRVRPSAG